MMSQQLDKHKDFWMYLIIKIPLILITVKTLYL